MWKLFGAFNNTSLHNLSPNAPTGKYRICLTAYRITYPELKEPDCKSGSAASNFFLYKYEGTRLKTLPVKQEKNAIINKYLSPYVCN